MIKFSSLLTLNAVRDHLIDLGDPHSMMMATGIDNVVKTEGVLSMAADKQVKLKLPPTETIYRKAMERSAEIKAGLDVTEPSDD